MKFSEKLKKARFSLNLKQEDLAKMTGITCRTLQNYEAGACKPKKREVYAKLAEALQLDESYLMNDTDAFVLDAAEKYGSRGSKQAAELVAEVSGLFAGGDMDEDDLDAYMQAIQQAYWIAKEKNKKYTPKRYRPKKSDLSD